MAVPVLVTAMRCTPGKRMIARKSTVLLVPVFVPAAPVPAATRRLHAGKRVIPGRVAVLAPGATLAPVLPGDCTPGSA